MDKQDQNIYFKHGIYTFLPLLLYATLSVLVILDRIFLSSILTLPLLYFLLNDCIHKLMLHLKQLLKQQI